ncbi:MAG: hypothetical protein FWC47_05200 [Oscillospiraceae bacterium]|nr:hypothetical protein [Oscillospiraceae bacterium]
MKNFFSLSIQRKDLKCREVFIFHNDGNYVDKKIEKNYPENTGKIKIYRENEYIGIFSYNTGFYDSQDVNIVRFINGEWGILHKDGKIYKNELIVEPIVEQGTHEIIGFSNGYLAPFYSKEGDMVFVNKYSEIITTGKIDKLREKILLKDKNDRTLSEWHFNEVFVPDEFFFLGGNFCELTQREDFNKLFKEFLEDKYCYYIFPSEIYGPKILVESNSDFSTSDKNAVNYGKLYILGYVYYTKREWSNYYFLKQYMKEQFQKEYDKFKKKIDRMIGSSYISEDRYNIWKIKDEFLVLDFYCDFGEGDFGYQIRMYIRKEPQN